MSERSLTRMALIMDQIRTASSIQQLVLMALASHVNDKRNDNLCWPSISVIAEKCVCSDRTVKRTIKELEALGFIQVFRHRKGKRNDSNRYRLNLDPALNIPLENRPKSKYEPKDYDCDDNYLDDYEPTLTNVTECHYDDGDSLAVTVTECHYQDGTINQSDKLDSDNVSPLTVTTCPVVSDSVSPLIVTECHGESVIESLKESLSVESVMSQHTQKHDTANITGTQPLESDSMTSKSFERFMSLWPTKNIMTASERKLAYSAWQELPTSMDAYSAVINELERQQKERRSGETPSVLPRWPSPERWLSGKPWLSNDDQLNDHEAPANQKAS